jgi:hypothetical protein
MLVLNAKRMPARRQPEMSGSRMMFVSDERKNDPRLHHSRDETLMACTGSRTEWSSQASAGVVQVGRVVNHALLDLPLGHYGWV